MPPPGAPIFVGGIWQACDPGQVFDINSIGLFQPSSAQLIDGYMKVGDNEFQYAGDSGIHVVVGMRYPGGEFEPVRRSSEVNAAVFGRLEANLLPTL